MSRLSWDEIDRIGNWGLSKLNGRLQRQFSSRQLDIEASVALDRSGMTFNILDNTPHMGMGDYNSVADDQILSYARDKVSEWMPQVPCRIMSMPSLD